VPDDSVITASSAPRSIEDILARGYSVKIGEYLHEGWVAFAGNPVGFVGFALACTLLAQALPLLAPMSGQLLSITIQVLMLAGIAIVTWAHLRNRRTTFGDFFLEWHTMAQVVLCTVVGLLFIVVGLFLLVIPGIYLAVAYSFSYMLVVDRRLGVWQALEGSRRVVGKNWWGVFSLTVMMLVLFGGGGVIGAGVLGLPIGYGLSGFFPTVSLDDLFLGLPPTGITLNLGLLIGLVSGMMVGGGLGVALAGCMLGAAYADIFGLASERSEAA
jgi:hypothetical protein